jgi:hypothetical protein
LRHRFLRPTTPAFVDKSSFIFLIRMMLINQAQDHSKLPHILLVEKNHLVGSVIALTARQLNLAIVRKAASINNAQQYLGHEAFSGLITTIDDEATDLKFLYELRNASFKASPDMPILHHAKL